LWQRSFRATTVRPACAAAKRHGPRNTDAGRISFSSIGKIDWEEGWHFVRIYAETTEGDRVFRWLDGEGNPIRFSDGRRRAHTTPHESDLFYVVTDDEVEIEPPQRAVPRVTA
jgi:DNA phosphorothioation-dependent restriction protein DptH